MREGRCDGDATTCLMPHACIQAPAAFKRRSSGGTLFDIYSLLSALYSLLSDDKLTTLLSCLQEKAVALTERLVGQLETKIGEFAQAGWLMDSFVNTELRRSPLAPHTNTVNICHTFYTIRRRARLECAAAAPLISCTPHIWSHLMSPTLSRPVTAHSQTETAFRVARMPFRLV